ncbi:hypothetical protein B0T09DRAFT_296368 [Sordaria sp. MPI-SDFR-AT-0083]|nr:hypothetical protein B0T09DRAFT_296368 [Sordaria sp. MPI-SDFR-AT-0083]
MRGPGFEPGNSHCQVARAPARQRTPVARIPLCSMFTLGFAYTAVYANGLIPTITQIPNVPPPRAHDLPSSPGLPLARCQSLVGVTQGRRSRACNKAYTVLAVYMRDTGALEDRIEQLTKVQRGANDGLNKLDNKCKADGYEAAKHLLSHEFNRFSWVAEAPQGVEHYCSKRASAIGHFYSKAIESGHADAIDWERLDWNLPLLGPFFCLPENKTDRQSTASSPRPVFRFVPGTFNPILTHFGVRLPDPSASLAQATAANRSHDCYPEGFKDVMMRFYNPGLSREHKLAKNYTNAAGRWPNFEMKDIACLLYASWYDVWHQVYQRRKYTDPLEWTHHQHESIHNKDLPSVWHAKPTKRIFPPGRPSYLTVH